MEEKWISQRKLQELEHEARVEIFDRIVDFALNGAITLDQAIIDYKGTCELQGIPLSPTKTNAA